MIKHVLYCLSVALFLGVEMPEDVPIPSPKGMNGPTQTQGMYHAKLMR